MNKHLKYYEGNDQISSGFEFIEKLVDAWFSPDAMVADLVLVELANAKLSRIRCV